MNDYLLSYPPRAVIIRSAYLQQNDVISVEFKKKNRGFRRDLIHRVRTVLIGLYQRTDALGAQNLTNLAPILVDAYSLQVRAKSSRGRLFRPGTVATEGRFLSTMRTLCHVVTS